MGADLLQEARRHLEAGHPTVARDLAEQALELNRAAGVPRHIAEAARTLSSCL